MAVDETAVKLLKMLSENPNMVINKYPLGYFTVQDGVKIGRVCSRRLSRLVKSGNIGKSNVGDTHIFIKE